MGCLLGCFGSSSGQKRRKQRNRILNPALPAAAAIIEPQNHSEKPIDPIQELKQDKHEERLNICSRKKVRFDPTIITHVQTPDVEAYDDTERSEENITRDPSSELGSYPPNYRYQNCRDSDDEMEESENEEDEDDESDLDEEENNHLDEDLSIDTLQRAHVCPVLKPIENVFQWKAAKADRGTGETPLKQRMMKDSTIGMETTIQDPSLPCFEPTCGREIAVDASLSSWLGPSSGGSWSSLFLKNGATPGGGVESEKNRGSGSSSSLISLEDRPIHGAVTVEELRQFPTLASPRRSPWRSPGSSHVGDETGDVASYKGIPNTTSKYTEEKMVSWHSTPFEARLERAVKRVGGAAAAGLTHRVQ